MGDSSSKRQDPRCVASTNGSSLESNLALYKSAAFSPDGTCVLTNSHDALRTFVLPTDLLASSSAPHILEPFSTLDNPGSVFSTAPYPYYSLADPSTTTILSGLTDHPIRLTNTLRPVLHGSYPLVNPHTEAYITPHSLLFTRDGTKFISGSDSLLAVFDVSRSGQGPIERRPTIPSKRKKIVGGGVGMKGIVSALGTSCEGLLAAGTFTRCIALYGDEGRGDFAGVFSLAGETSDVGGSGVTQTLWSPCGRYLYVVERMSDGMLVYDVRVAGKKLSVLVGRKAVTNQRMAVDVVASGDGHEVWAGGTDGVVRVWPNPHLVKGLQASSMSWDAHTDSISSVKVHPYGNVVATCSGQRRTPDYIDTSSDLDSDNGSQEGSGDQRTPDFSLKIWSWE